MTVLAATEPAAAMTAKLSVPGCGRISRAKSEAINSSLQLSIFIPAALKISTSYTVEALPNKDRLRSR